MYYKVHTEIQNCREIRLKWQTRKERPNRSTKKRDRAKRATCYVVREVVSDYVSDILVREKLSF